MIKTRKNQTIWSGVPAASGSLSAYFKFEKAEFLVLLLSMFFVSAAFLPMTKQGDAMSTSLDPNRIREIGFLVLGLALMAWLCYLRNGGRKIIYKSVFFLIPIIFVGWTLVLSPWSKMQALSIAKALELGIVVLVAAMVITIIAERPVLLDKFPELLVFSILLIIGVYLIINVFIWGELFPIVDPPDMDLLEVINPAEPIRPRFSLAYVHPLLAADVFSIGIVSLIASGIKRKYQILLTAFLFALIWITDARGALVSTIAAVCVMAFSSIRQLGLKIAAIVLTCGLVPLIFLLDLFSIGVSVWGEEAATLNGRLNLWASVFEVFSRKPIIGYGYFASRSLTMTEFEWAGHAHNTFFEILLTTGIIGGLLFIIFTACLIYLLIKTNDRLLLGVTVYCYAAGFLNPLLFTPGFPMFMLILCALRAVICRKYGEAAEKRKEYLRRLWIVNSYSTDNYSGVNS